MTTKNIQTADGKTLEVDFDWQTVLADLELNQEGEFFVDWLATQLLRGVRQRAMKRGSRLMPNLGEKGARELAVAILARFWNGEIPDGFPMLVKLDEVRREEMTAAVWND